MNTRAMLSLAAVFLLVVVFYACTYRVYEYERAVHLRFGAIHQEDVQPGLHFKLPVVDDVRKFDGRLLTVDADPESFYTVQKKRLIVDSFAKFKVVDVGTYYRSTGGDADVAENRLAARVNDGLRNAFGKRTLLESVSGERDAMVEVLTAELDKAARESLGVTVLDVRIKRIDLPEDISDDVYKRMRAEREKLALEFRSQGSEEAVKIRADADRQKVLLEAEAYRKSELLRGEGDAEAAAIYAEAYSKDAEFYAFWRSLEAYKNSFSSKSDLIVLEPESDFFRYLKDSGKR